MMPKRLESQLAYFSDQVHGGANTGSADSSTANVARAELFRKRWIGTWRLVTRWKLVNEVSPASALVADDGSLVTFDNWHSVGYGDDVVAIYRPDGSLVRKFGLAAFLETGDIDQLDHSVSSIWWHGTHRINDSRRELVLQVRGRHDPTTRGRDWGDENRIFEEILVSLDTGEILTPKHPIFPRPSVTLNSEDLPESCVGGPRPFSR